ncbi:YggT family protein [Comamonas sp. BIGb0124]|uniref:YggT family protein n=1 Tax=Comamonas sp. BIGb0124 TaxID=2485130 RepID=UPI000F46275F|nr:YggT family protein [Comamonas sp. BIGb0124]ROR23224.1 YggT family protein [Comamonas sp. BIGb0124]
MLIQILSLILNVAVGLLAGACLLRLYMQWTGTPFYNPIGHLVLSLTNWVVLPLRRFIPALGRLDTASLVAAMLMKVLQHLLLSALLGGLMGAATPLAATLVMALFDLLALALSLCTAILIASVIASWLRTDPAINHVLQRLAAPLLDPIRRWLPTPGGLDLSPLVALVLIQILSIVLGYLQDGVLRSLVVG